MEKYLKFSQRHISKAEFSADIEALTASGTLGKEGTKRGSSAQPLTNASYNSQQQRTQKLPSSSIEDNTVGNTEDDISDLYLFSTT
ncbi:hypothetical protein I79_018907 [Cricetulus griseus]|uniref:Uncharacterized protein n=1 Tax=Cricetulus griseus TaxID=10029 RepID=G3I5Z6_CRIGR|nr:hypothetical protein I79_018907 [Cricetulus griseus]